MVAGQCWLVRVWRLCRLHLRFGRWAVRVGVREEMEPHCPARACQWCPLPRQSRPWPAQAVVVVETRCREPDSRLGRFHLRWAARAVMNAGTAEALLDFPLRVIPQAQGIPWCQARAQLTLFLVNA